MPNLKLIPLLAALAMIASSCAERPTQRVALVFDDGPDPELAPKLLELFEREGIRVTFAQVASTMQQHPDTSQATLAAGHEIVNHSHDHHRPAELTDEELHHEIVGAQRAITAILGVAPKWYWPPFLDVDERVEATVSEAGIKLYPRQPLVSSSDWDRSVSAEQIRTNATTGVTDGCVVLFHEWREETYQQLPAIIEELRRQGCSFHTFSELHASLQQEPARAAPDAP